MRYFKKMCFSIYYLLFSTQFKYLDFKSAVYFSVKVQGKKFITIQKGSTIQRYGWLLALKIDNKIPILNIGQRCAIGDSCHITSVRKVIIEDDVLIANRVYISDNVHSFMDVGTPIIQQKVEFKNEVIIGKGSWIGENVCIIGAKIGENCVIGANSVVTKDIPDFCIAVGIPAKVIKKYNFDNKEWDKI